MHRVAQPVSERRIDGIDLLRGISILFVLMNHVNMRLLGAKVPYTKGLPLQPVETMVWSGQMGVQMFFVISGFLIMSMSLRRWHVRNGIPVRDFYGMRTARIAPLMVALLSVLCLLHLLAVRGYVVSQQTGGLGRALLTSLTFHINWLEASRGYLPGNWDILWSLSVEEMFYLFFPLVILVCRRWWMLYGVLAIFIVAGPFARMKAFNPNPVWREYSYLGGMDAIAIGCLTALLISTKRLPGTWIRICGVVGMVLLIFSLGFSLRASAWGLAKNGLSMTVLAVGTALTIVAGSQSKWRAPRAFFPLLSLGRHSYEVYLTHMFTVLGLFALFVRAGKPMRDVPWLFAAVIVMAGITGWAVAVGYSEPLNRRIRRMIGASGE